MQNCKSSPAPIVKGDKYRDFQCPRNQYEIDQIKVVPYASAVGSLQYAQVYTCPDLTFVTGLLDRFQSNYGTEHWKLVKKVLCYLQGMKSLMMTYRRSDSLHIVGYSDSDYAGDDKKSTSRYVFTLAGELFHGKAQSKLSLHRPQCMLSL